MKNKKRTADGLRAGTATIRKGKTRSREILEVARQSLVDKGYKELTLRNVAHNVGISIGNLQYYYRTKEDLEREMLQYASDREIKECYELLEKSSGDAERRFTALIDFLLMRIKKPDTRGLHLQGWALATHDNYAEYCMEQLYKDRCAIIEREIKRLNPSIDRTECSSRATVIHALIVGSVYSLQAKGSRLIQRRGLEKIIKKRALSLARSPAS